MAECNETIVGVEMCKDIFGKYVDKSLCQELVNLYDLCGRQLYRLREAWGKFLSKKRNNGFLYQIKAKDTSLITRLPKWEKYSPLIS